MRVLCNTRVLGCLYKTFRTRIYIYSISSSPTVSQIAAIRPLYYQMKKSRHPLSFMPISNYKLHFFYVYISYSESKVFSEVLYNAGLNKLCNMKHHRCLLECLLFILLKNWIDFCFMLDVLVSCSAFRSVFQFSGWRLLLQFLPEECVPSSETVQLYHRSKVGEALSSIVRKHTQTNTEAHTQHHNTNNVSSASSVCLFLMTCQLLWRSVCLCMCVSFKASEYTLGKWSPCSIVLCP